MLSTVNDMKYSCPNLNLFPRFFCHVPQNCKNDKSSNKTRRGINATRQESVPGQIKNELHSSCWIKSKFLNKRKYVYILTDIHCYETCCMRQMQEEHQSQVLTKRKLA